MKTKFLSTAIGSMPYTDPEEAVAMSLGGLDAPIWPQLPRLGLREQMEIQYCEGMPRAVIDESKSRMYLDTSGDYSEEFGAFYEDYMAAAEDESSDFSAAAISPAFSKGIYALERALEAKGERLPFLKVQTTGPCSFALTITDENKRAIYYNEEFRDVVIKALSMKCRWQLKKFAPYADRLICFIDEPILSAFGSSTYVSVKREDVVAALSEVIDAIHAEDALAGIHCCGNTEWSILTDAGADIVNFDAFGYGDTILMYADAVRAHLERGGLLAWGVVPTSEAIREQTVETLEALLERYMDGLAAHGIEKRMIAGQAILTPSCGAGSLSESDTRRVFDLLAGLSSRMKAKA